MDCNHILGGILNQRNIIANNIFKFLIHSFRNNKIKPLLDEI